jgi:hypothetical protein
MDALTSAKFLAGTQGRWLASQGPYFKAISPTIGTGQLGPTATAFAATTSAFLCIQNTAGAGSNVFVYPDLARFLVSVADVVSAGSSLQYALVLDQALRYSSGGTQLVTPGTYANNNGPTQSSRIGATPLGGQATGAKSYGPQAAIFAGALVLTAESANAVRIGRGIIKVAAASPVCVVADEYFFSFSNSYDSGAGQSKIGTTAAIYRQNPGLVGGIGPQGSLALHLWEANQTTAPTLETDIGWWEAPSYPA